MYELIIALLIKMQIKLASRLKRQRCENCKKKNTTVEQYIKDVILTLNTPEQTKLSKYWTCLSD